MVDLKIQIVYFDILIKKQCIFDCPYATVCFRSWLQIAIRRTWELMHQAVTSVEEKKRIASGNREAPKKLLGLVVRLSCGAPRLPTTTKHNSL